jgi:hypothetical protein
MCLVFNFAPMKRSVFFIFLQKSHIRCTLLGRHRISLSICLCKELLNTSLDPVMGLVCSVHTVLQWAYMNLPTIWNIQCRRSDFCCSCWSDGTLTEDGLNGVANFIQKGKCNWILFHKSNTNLHISSQRRLMASPLFHPKCPNLADWKTGSIKIVGLKV